MGRQFAGPSASGLCGGVPTAPHLADRAALHGLLERVAEPQGPPVLTAELLADLAATQLTLLLEEVLDQRDLPVQPPLVLFLVDARRRRERRIARRTHRSLSRSASSWSGASRRRSPRASRSSWCPDHHGRRPSAADSRRKTAGSR